MIHKIELHVDDDDFRDIQKELAFRRARRDVPGDHEDGANIAGLDVGEIVRDLWDYRALAGATNPPTAGKAMP